MSTESKARYTLTAPATLTFAHFAKAEAVAKGGKPKFSCNFELEPGHPDEGPIKALILQVARQARPGIALADFQKPLASGDKLADKAIANAKKKGKWTEGDDPRGFSRGKQVLTSRSDYRPGLSYIERGAVIDIEDENTIVARERDTFYSGVQALGEVEFVWYDEVGENGSPGVTAYLNKVCSIKKGEKIMGKAVSAAETFKGYVGLASQEDPTKTGDATDENW